MTGNYTYSERIAAGNLFYDSAVHAEIALDMLQGLWDRWFDHADQPAINAYDAEEIGTTLNAISKILFEAVRDFHLESGSPEAFAGSAAYLSHAAQYQKIARISSLCNEISEIERSLPGEKWDAICAKRTRACALPDEQAIQTLEALLKEIKA